MSGHLAKILKNSNHLSIHKEVPLFAASYFSDFNLKISDSLHSKLLSALETHLNSYDLKEMSHLAVSISA